MAPRFQMKVGLLADASRLPDSPDTVVVVEPTVGSRARSKGQLYLLVTSMVPGPRAREATRLVAEAVRHEYYYDESAGIRVCLVKAVLAANKRLGHARERAALAGGTGAVPGSQTGAGGGPVGVAIAVVRDHELYVATVGPAEAYLSRGARLSTLPDPHRERGLPTGDLEPEVWRGEIGLGDQLVLVSPNVMALIGAEALKDALVTLHPQAAIEDLQHRFVEAGGRGSDGGLVVEVGEASTLKSGRTLTPVRPPEPLAGAPDRSPIPLADTVSGGVAAATAGARRARSAAGGAAGRFVARLQDAMPARRPAPRRVTSLANRRELQQRAAVAILAFVAVVGLLGIGVSLLGNRAPATALASAEVGQAALDQAKNDLSRVTSPGVDLVTTDPHTAEGILNDALTQLDTAAKSGIPASAIAPYRAAAVKGLDRLYGVVDITPVDAFTFPADAGVNLTGLVQGPDGAPYVLDAKTATVYRISLADRKAVAIYREGNKEKAGTEAAPRFLATGGPDLLVLDAKNALWRWRPADATGKGTTTRVGVTGSAEWGTDIVAIGTFLRDSSRGLYNFYIVDPSAQEILAYAPAADGNGFPGAPAKRLTTPRAVDGVTSMLIDGDIWITDGGKILRVSGGTTEGWTAAGLPDGRLRAAPSYRAVMSASDRRTGRLYGYDPANARLIAFYKSSGDYIEQYRLADGSTGWADARGWYILPGTTDTPETVVWITATGLSQALLEPAVAGPGASGSPSPTGTPAPSTIPGASSTP